MHSRSSLTTHTLNKQNYFPVVLIFPLQLCQPSRAPVLLTCSWCPKAAGVREPRTFPRTPHCMASENAPAAVPNFPAHPCHQEPKVPSQRSRVFPRTSSVAKKYRGHRVAASSSSRTPRLCLAFPRTESRSPLLIPRTPIRCKEGSRGPCRCSNRFPHTRRIEPSRAPHRQGNKLCRQHFPILVSRKPKLTDETSRRASSGRRLGEEQPEEKASRDEEKECFNFRAKCEGRAWILGEII